MTALGEDTQLDWHRQMVTNRFEAKVKGSIGPGKTVGKSMRVLISLFQWMGEGVNYETDQRHAEIVINELGLREGSKSVNPPRTSIRHEEVTEGGSEVLEPHDRTLHRGSRQEGITLHRTVVTVGFASRL